VIDAIIVPPAFRGRRRACHGFGSEAEHQHNRCEPAMARSRRGARQARAVGTRSAAPERCAVASALFRRDRPRPRDCLSARTREGGVSRSRSRSLTACGALRVQTRGSGDAPTVSALRCSPGASVFCLSPPKRNGFACFEGAPSGFALPLPGSRKIHGQHLHAQSPRLVIG
jgi:hypothetical protein